MWVDSASAFLVPKNVVKCRLILNTEVGVRPSKFKLPLIEELPSWPEGLPPVATPFFVKVGLHNACWLVALLRQWRRLFVVNGMVVRTLPFGSAFSPDIF